jgi:hypothetical protein
VWTTIRATFNDDVFGHDDFCAYVSSIITPYCQTMNRRCYSIRDTFGTSSVS